MKPPDRIHQAFLYLQFTVKLFRYFEMGMVRKEVFDCAIEIPMPGEPLRLEANTYHTYNDLVLAAQNVYSSALGVCAIALESALNDFGVANNPLDASPSGQLRSFVYQVRNAFAHDAMTPSWSAKGPYGRTYDLRTCGIAEPVNLQALNGQALELEQFGGMRGFEALRDAVLRLVTSGDGTLPGEA
jgi:hypothetical protein